MTKVSIKPSPGYILAIPYIEDNKVFKGVKETAGLDQFSEVVAVGGEIMDDHGNIRATHVNVGDVIIHAASNKEFEQGFDKYRFVHFSEVHGII